MLVASIATYNKRVPFIRPSVESITTQAGVDRVFVATGTPEVQKQAQAVCEGLPVMVVLVEEIGPGKKHLVSQFCDASDEVITFDDDRIYPEGYAQFLVDALRANKRPTGLVGFQATAPLRPVREGACDFLHGEYSWVYRAEWIDPKQIVAYGSNPSCFANDDVYLGWLFAQQGHSCWVAPDSGHKHQQGVQVNTGARIAAALRNSPGAIDRWASAMKETFWRDQPVVVGKPRSATPKALDKNSLLEGVLDARLGSASRPVPHG